MLNNQSASILPVAQVEANTMSNNSLQTLAFESNAVRFIPEGDSFWVVGADVLRALDYAESSVAQANNVFASIPAEWADHKPIMVRSSNGVEKFEKEHKNVLRDIQNLTASLDQDFTKLNFELSAYKDSTGRTLPMYNLTRDGFSLLVMGFTGEKALQWKVVFINAFNAMEAQLRESMPNFNDPVEAAEAWLKAEKSRRAAEEKARLEAEAHAKTQHAFKLAA